MTSGKNITLGVGFNVDRSGLSILKKELQQLQKLTAQDLMSLDKSLNTEQAEQKLKEILKATKELQTAFNSAYNVKLDTLDITKFNKALSSGSVELKQIYNSLRSVGSQGENSFRNMATALLSTNVNLKQSHKILDEIAQTMTNTVKWGVTSSIFNNITNSIQKAWNYTKELDSSLNDIRIVTDKSADSMEVFAKQANKAAQSLGASTKDYANAALIYYQQGLSEEDVQARAQTTLKAANVTGQSGQEVSEQLTAVWNGYKVSAQEAELYIDKLAAVAADTAADLEELSTGMSKVASAANLMGVDIDQLNAQLATIVSVTRQAPESVGTALKTIYARMGDIKAGLDGEVTLDEYTSQMAEMGVNVLNADGQLRDMGTVIEEIGEKWTLMSREQQISLSQIMAGTRQYNNLLSLFDNWDMYTEALNTSANAAGTLQKQQDIYMESTSAHLKELGTAWERVFDAFVDDKGVNNLIDVLTDATSLLGNFIETLGGGGNTLLMLGSIGSQVFSKQIAEGISTTITNLQNAKENVRILNAELEILEDFKGIQQLDSVTKKLVDMKQEIINLDTIATNEEKNTANNFILKRNELENEYVNWNNTKNQTQDFYQQQTGNNIDITNINKNDAEKYINDLKDIENEYKNVTKNAENFSKQLLKANDAYIEVDENLTDSNWNKFEKSLIDVRDEVEGYINDIQELIDRDQVSTETRNKMSQALLNYQNALSQSDEGDWALATDINVQEQAQLLVNTYVKAGQEIKTGAVQARGVIEQEVKGATQNIINNIDITEAEYEKFIAKLKQKHAIMGIVELASAFGQIATILNTISNIDNIFTDESLSAGEKMLQLFMAFSTTLPIVINLFNLLSSAIPKIAIGMGAVKVGTDVASLGFKQATISVLAFETALGPLWLVLLGITAVVAAVTGGVYALVKAYNKDAEAAERAAQATEELNQRYIELKTSAESFKDAISDYSDGIEALEDLEKHTDEYKQALEEVNKQAKELIETYGLWNDYSIEDGIIKIDKEKLQQKQREKEKQARDVETNYYAASIISGQTSLKSQRTNLSRKIGTLQVATDENGIFLEGTTRQSQERTSESLQLDDNSIQTIINGLNKKREENSEYDLDLRTDEQLKKDILSIQELSPAIRENIDQIIKQKEALQLLTEETYNNIEAEKYKVSQIMQNKIEQAYGEQLENLSKDKEGNVDTARYNQLVAIVSNNKKAQENMVQNFKDLDTSKKYSTNNSLNKNYGYDIQNDEDLARTYAKEVLGYTQEEINKMGYNKDTGKGTLKQSDGTMILDGYSDAMMREQLAQLSKSKEIENNYSNNLNEQSQINALQTLMNNAEIAGSKYGTDFTNSLLNSLASEDKKIDLSSVFAEINPSEYKELSSLQNTQDILNLFGLTEEQLIAAGYESAEQFANNFKAGLNGYEWDVDKALDAAITKQQGDIEKYDLDSKNLTNYAKQLMSVSQESELLADSLEENADAGVIVAKTIMRMNDGIDSLADGFKEWAEILKESSKESEEYSEALDGIRTSLSDILNTEEDFISEDYIVEHLEDIKKAAEGNEDAIQNLKDALIEDIVLKVAAENDLEYKIPTLLDQIENLQATIPNIDVGTEIHMDETTYDNFIARMQDIINTAGMTAEQANALFSTMGFEAEFVTEKQPVKKTGYGTRTVTEFLGEKEVTMPDGSTMSIPAGWETKTYPGEPYEYVDYVDAIAMSTDGKTPKINKITKTATPSMNNYSSSNKGGGSPGKSGGSDKKPDKKDPVENKKDIYHDINIILKQISTELDRLEKQEEKLVGQDLIDNLNEQWSRLQDTIDATNEKIKIARGEMSRLQGELGAKGVTFNPDGTIANYAAVYDQQLATVNAVINHYNSLSADAQEGYKETVEQAEKNWEEFLEDISEYDELVSEMIPELEDEIQAAIDEQIEIQIEKFNMEIELRLDMAEAEREWNEFKKRIIDDIEDDDILGNASAKLLDYGSYYKEDGTGVIQKNTQHVNEIIEQLKSIEATGTSSIYGDNEAQALEDLKTYYEQLMSDLTDVHDLVDEIRESYLDMMDEAQDKFDEQVETYEYIRDLLTHDMDLITMVYGDESYDKLVDFYQKQEDNYNKQLDFQRQQKDFWKAQMDSLEEGSDEWDKAKENWMSAVEEWNSTVEEAIENLQDKYLNAINNIFANLNDKVTDGLGLDYVEQEWDLINKNADQYLDTINAVFETQQLENKYLDAIDNTDNISAQQKLNDLMKEEIKALEQKDKLTEYDIERANLKYEIALKQIALEEAQQTKSSMRLRRDSQGNYRYEFVADNDAIREAEDELSVLQNQLYNMDVEQYRSNLDQLYEIYVEWQEALAEAAQINDPEARAERELMINEQYGELINGIVEENEVIKTNLRESAFDELVNLHQMELEEVQALSQAEKDIMLEDMIPQWTSGVQTMADAFAGEGGFIPTCKDALIDLDNATQDYEDSLLELQYQGGFTFNDIVAGESEAIYVAQGLLQVNNALIGSYQAEFDALRNVLGQLDGLIGKYGAAQNAANAAAEAAYKYADALLAQFAAAQGSYTGKGYFYNSGGSSNRGTTTVPTQKNTSGSGGVDTTKNNNTTSKNTNGKSGTYAVFEEGGRIAGSVVLTNGQVTSSSGVMKLANQPRKVYLADGSYVGTFATGGYTGEWNSSEGKIGILHQKELVLNQRDTENILGAVEIMRQMTNSIDNSIFARVADFTSGIGITAPELSSQALEQNVHIEANFPNVQSSREIEEAIDNLSNIASQRANKTTRY